MQGSLPLMTLWFSSYVPLPEQETQKMDLSKLMNPPYSMLHHRWMREPAARVPQQSCR